MNVHILHSAKYAALPRGEHYETSDMLCSSNAAKAVQTIISLAIIAFHSNLLEVVFLFVVSQNRLCMCQYV